MRRGAARGLREKKKTASGRDWCAEATPEGQTGKRNPKRNVVRRGDAEKPSGEIGAQRRRQQGQTGKGTLKRNVVRRGDAEKPAGEISAQRRH